MGLGSALTLRYTRLATAILLVAPSALAGCSKGDPADTNASTGPGPAIETGMHTGNTRTTEDQPGTGTLGTVSTAGSSAKASDPDPELSSAQIRRGDRYGQIVLVRRNGLSIRGEVWGTQGVSEWDPKAWDALDTKQIENESGAMRAFLNGPNIWLPDEVTGSTPSDKRRTFGRVAVRLLTTREINPRQRPEPYKARDLERDVTITFRQGTVVHELVLPSGTVYVMQSVSLAVDGDQTLDTLANLASQLDLPDGWTFRSRTLEADLVLPADEQASTIEDDLKNVYQRR